MSKKSAWNPKTALLLFTLVIFTLHGLLSNQCCFPQCYVIYKSLIGSTG